MSTTPPLSTDAPTAARDLRDAVQRLIVAHGRLQAPCRPCGTPLAIPHACALLVLLQRGPMTVTTLADHMCIDRTNVSRLCARMVKQGELHRTRHPDDRRAWLVGLTDSGRALADLVDVSSAAHFTAVLAQLPDTGAFIECLGKLTRALDASAAAHVATIADPQELS